MSAISSEGSSLDSLLLSKNGGLIKSKGKSKDLTPMRLGALVSGNGTNLEAILDACEGPDFPAQVAVVISNRKEAFALERAKRHQIPHFVVENGPALEASILKILKEYRVELVSLAGFMKILSPAFIREFPQKILNIHPSLLPRFPGLNAQEQALLAKAKTSGATVHIVDEGCDTGPILLQKEVPVLANDTVATLKARILEVEHEIYPKAIRLVATQCLKIVNGKVILRDQGGK